MGLKEKKKANKPNKQVVQTEGKWHQRDTWNFRNEERAIEITNTWVNILFTPLEFLKICIIVASKPNGRIFSIYRCDTSDIYNTQSGI